MALTRVDLSLMMRATDTNDDAVSGAKIRAFRAGTTTAVTLYSDEDGTTPHATPIVCDASGVPDPETVYAYPGKYKFQITDSDDVDLPGSPFDNYIVGADALIVYDTVDDAKAAHTAGAIGTGDRAMIMRYSTSAPNFPWFALAGATANTNPGDGPYGPIYPSVQPQLFGAFADGTTNDTTAMAEAVAYAIANERRLVIPEGTYLLDAGGTLNFVGAGLQIIGEGRPILKYTGSGIGFNIDAGGTPGTAVGEMSIENLIIEGNASVTDGCYWKGIVRSYWRDIEVRECSSNAFHILHGVASTYEGLVCSANATPGQTTTPNNGIYLTDNSTYFTADCKFNSVRMEGFSGTGINLNYASGCVFTGGTSEVVNKGSVVASGCTNNTFNGMWYEANTTSDHEDSGKNTLLSNCYAISSGATSLNIQAISSEGLQIVGGRIRAINLQSTSKRTNLHGVGFSDNVSLGIQGSGAYTSIGCFEFDTSGNHTGDISDLTGDAKQSLTPTFEGLTTAGSTTYTTQTGSYVKHSRSVTFHLTLVVSAFSGAAGTLVVRGLPTADVTTPVSISQYAGVTLPSGSQLCAEMVGGTDYIRFYAVGSGVSQALLTPSNVSPTIVLVVGGSYNIG